MQAVYDMDENLKCYTKWKKRYKRPWIVWFLLYEMPRAGKSMRQKAKQLLPTIGELRGNGQWLLVGGGILGGNENVLKLILLTIAQAYDCWLRC